MNQSTTTQSKSRFRPVKVATDGLPGGPLPTQATAQSVAQNPAARPAIIRKVVDPGTGGQIARVVLARQDEMSQPSPRMLSEERLQRYVQSLKAQEASKLNTPTDQAQFSDSVVTWTTPQVRQAISSSETTLIRPKTIHHAHPAHSAPEPTLRGWPEEAEIESVEVASVEVASVEAALEAEAQLEQAVEIDEKLRQLEQRIEQLRSKEVSKPEADRLIREQEILANPNTGDLVAAISTAIVSALQEKSEAEVLPQAKSVFEKSLQQHAVTLGEQSDSVVVLNTSEQLANEAMFSAIAAQRQQEQASDTISDTLSPTTLLNNLRERIADYQRTMTSQTASEAADLVKLSDEPMPIEPMPIEVVPTAELQGPLEAVETVEPPPAEIVSVTEASPSPLVQFTAPADAAVPLEAASWDVEDFRWSSLSNQMLTSGSQAIKNLLDVALAPTTSETKAKRIAVAGAGRGQGTTTIATALARAGNQAGYKTLLIDADVASPQLSQTVGLSAKISWLTGIGTELPLGEVVIRSKKTNLCLMPLSATVNRVTWPRFIFDNLGEMLANAESHFDLILIDAGPASQLLDELSNPEQLLDAMVLVDANAKLKEIEVYQNRLQTFGVDNLVLAENRKPESALDVA